MDRVDQIKRFGEVKPWLEERVRQMSGEAWTWFYDSIESGVMKVPQRIEETMPRDADDLISNPDSTPPQYQTEHRAKWEAWKQIWGPAPWEVPPSGLKVRPRIGKFRD